MFRRTAVVAGAVLICTVTGCVSLIVKHSPLPAASQKLGAVALTVNNARAKDEGLENSKLVGRVRNLYGMPIKMEADNDVIDAVKKLHADALASAGYDIADNAPAKVVVDVKRLFMDGYMGYKIDFVSEINVSGGAATLARELVVEYGFHYKKPQSMYDAYDTLMNRVAEKALDVYKSQEFADAVK